jgi:hypothetical protein
VIAKLGIFNKHENYYNFYLNDLKNKLFIKKGEGAYSSVYKVKRIADS